jgi:hypothetical protein
LEPGAILASLVGVGTVILCDFGPTSLPGGNVRFRYISDEGEEIRILDVSGLASVIRDGHVRADTLLFDARSERWAAAAEHDVFVLTGTETTYPTERSEVDAPSPVQVDLASEVRLPVARGVGTLNLFDWAWISWATFLGAARGGLIGGAFGIAALLINLSLMRKDELPYWLKLMATLCVSLLALALHGMMTLLR